MNIKTTDCYLPFKCKDRLPDSTGEYICKIRKGDREVRYFNKRTGWAGESNVNNSVSQWLEKKTGYFLTEAELNNIRRNDYAAGVDWAINERHKGGEQYEKYLTEYLKEPLDHTPDVGK